MKTITAGIGILTMGVLAAGCGAAPSGAGDGGPLPPVSTTDEPGKDVSNLDLGPPGAINTMPARGGSGGSPVPGLSGGVIYAFQVNTGRLVDQISLAYYIPSNPDNRYRTGDFFSTLGPVGGPGGTFQDWQYCPPDFAVSGMQGRSGAKLDAVGMICKGLLNENNQVTLPVFGGGGGQAFRDTCPTGRLMTLVNLRAGRVIDRIQGVCQAMK